MVLEVAVVMPGPEAERPVLAVDVFPADIVLLLPAKGTSFGLTPFLPPSSLGDVWRRPKHLVSVFRYHAL